MLPEVRQRGLGDVHRRIALLRPEDEAHARRARLSRRRRGGDDCDQRHCRIVFAVGRMKSQGLALFVGPAGIKRRARVERRSVAGAAERRSRAPGEQTAAVVLKGGRPVFFGRPSGH